MDLFDELMFYFTVLEIFPSAKCEYYHIQFANRELLNHSYQVTEEEYMSRSVQRTFHR